MNKILMSEKEKISVDTTMAAIRNNTVPSKCISIFEDLLSEVGEMDESIVHVVVADLNRFIENTLTVFRESDKIGNRSIKSRMISRDFIQPRSYFVRTKKELGKVYDIKDNYSAKHLVYKPEGVLLGIDHELSRKVLLIWNYIPAICKAVIMTKRRSLGLDKNSKKFEGV